MGYSVRTDYVRYTEWRDWKTGEVVARELYDTENNPAELINTAGSPSNTDAYSDAVKAMREQFPKAPH
jgi:iduronate 2-sulfatase